jgi:hypothetical protein
MKLIVLALILSANVFGQISTVQTAQIVHTNRPGTIELKNVHKGDWLKITVRWTQGGEVIGVFTDNFFDAWYPSLLNTHGAVNQEEFEAVSKADGKLSVPPQLEMEKAFVR